MSSNLPLSSPVSRPSPAELPSVPPCFPPPGQQILHGMANCSLKTRSGSCSTQRRSKPHLYVPRASLSRRVRDLDGLTRLFQLMAVRQTKPARPIIGLPRQSIAEEVGAALWDSERNPLTRFARECSQKSRTRRPIRIIPVRMSCRTW